MAHTREEARRGEIAATGRRYCSGCSLTKNAFTGTQRGNRWICADCIKRAQEHMRSRAK